MTGERDCSYRRSAVASTDVVDCVLKCGGAAGQRGSVKVDGTERLGTGVLLLPICPAALLPTPQLQLGFLFHHTIERECDSAYCQTLRICQNKSAASGIGELSVERCGREGYGARAGRVIGVRRFDQEAVCGESALSEPPAKPLREQAEQGKEAPEVVGIGCERVAHVKLRLPLRW